MTGERRLAHLIALAGGLLLAVSVLFLDWYTNEGGKIAPLQIDATVRAQAQDTPPAFPPTSPPGVPTTPGPGQLDGVDPDDIPGADAEAPPDRFGAWHGQGAVRAASNVILLLVAALAVAMAVLTIAARRPPPQAWLALAGTGLLAVVIVGLRMAFRVEEIGGYQFDAGLAYGIFFALAGALLIASAGMLGAREPD